MNNTLDDFKVGEKVKYIGNFSPELEGDTGNVVELNHSWDVVEVRWNNKGRIYGVKPENIKHHDIVPEELFKI